MRGVVGKIVLTQQLAAPQVAPRRRADEIGSETRRQSGPGAHAEEHLLLEDRAGSRRGRIGNLGALWVEVDADGTITVGDRVELIDEGELQSAQSSDIL